MNTQEWLYYLKIIKKRWWLIMLLVVSTVGSILVAFYTAEPVYQASLKFLFSAPPLADLTVYGDYRNPSVRDEVVYARANFIEILNSTSTIWQAVDTLGIDLRADDVVVIVEPSENSEIVRLTVEMRDPQLAADMANTLIDVALKTYGELRAKPTTVSREFISTQLEEVYVAWRQAQERLTGFQIENGITELSSAITSQNNLIRNLTFERDSALVNGDLEKIATYDEMISKHEEELQNLVWLSGQYNELETTVRQTREIYELLLSRETEAALRENEIMSVGFVSVLGPAWPPVYPVSAFNAKLVLLGALVSFVVGALVVVAWESLETRKVFDRLGDQVTAQRYEPQEGTP